MKPGFAFPEFAEVWVPLGLDPDAAARDRARPRSGRAARPGRRARAGERPTARGRRATLDAPSRDQSRLERRAPAGASEVVAACRARRARRVARRLVLRPPRHLRERRGPPAGAGQRPIARDGAARRPRRRSHAPGAPDHHRVHGAGGGRRRARRAGLDPAQSLGDELGADPSSVSVRHGGRRPSDGLRRDRDAGRRSRLRARAGRAQRLRRGLAHARRRRSQRRWAGEAARRSAPRRRRARALDRARHRHAAAREELPRAALSPTMATG